MQIKLNHSISRQGAKPLRFDENLSISDSHNVIGLYGASGAGKTSFLKALAGLQKGANVVIQKGDLDKQSGKNIEKSALNNPCVYVGEDTQLFANLNVEQNLKWVCKHASWRHKPARGNNNLSVNYLVELCQLKHLLHSRTEDLSSGEKQRVKFARAVLSAKPILLLDEPFSALDLQTRSHMQQVLIMLTNRYQFCCLMVSHSLEELALCSQQLLHMQEAKIVRNTNTLQAINDIQQNQHFGEQAQFSVLEGSYSHQDKSDANVDVWCLLENGVDLRQTKDGSETCYLYSKSDDSTVHTSRVRLVGDQLQTDDQPQTKESLVIAQERKFIVHADKISLFIDKPKATSMLNSFTGIIESIIPNQHSVMVTSRILGSQAKDEQNLLRASITQKSCRELELRVGQEIHALFKAL